MVLEVLVGRKFTFVANKRQLFSVGYIYVDYNSVEMTACYIMRMSQIALLANCLICETFVRSSFASFGGRITNKKIIKLLIVLKLANK